MLVVREILDAYGPNIVASTPEGSLTVGFTSASPGTGLNYAKRLFDIAEGLIRRRYSDANIEAILGDNFRRVLREIWTV
jgi:microsomal dipeptidase-like Zn-dependent dipeptidase